MLLVGKMLDSIDMARRRGVGAGFEAVPRRRCGFNVQVQGRATSLVVREFCRLRGQTDPCAGNFGRMTMSHR